VPTFESGDGPGGEGGELAIRNLPPGQEGDFPARDVVDGGFLQLVRYGVRQASDRNVTATLPVIDAVLKVDLPCGSGWHRYNHDGYGEHPDGAPFDGSGVGRAWPLLSGERAHYALAAGDREEAQRLARALECFANEGAFLSEQVWDSADIPAKGLRRGRPTGSAMPLVWAHAEYLKLLRSLGDQQVFDLLPPAARRYKDGPPARRSVWRFNHKISVVQPGEPLRIEVLAPVRLHWSSDGWQTVGDSDGVASGFGAWYVDLPREATAQPGALAFTFYWPRAERWEGTSFTVRVEG
jgi:glucoamylase